jgi:hypothetical protein
MSGRENVRACLAWVEDRILMTICGGGGSARSTDIDEGAIAVELRVAAMRDGIRSAKVTSGYGSIAIDVKEESVAP